MKRIILSIVLIAAGAAGVWLLAARPVRLAEAGDVPAATADGYQVMVAVGAGLTWSTVLARL